MTLPLGQRTLRERSALRSLVERALESKGFRHGLCEKPLTVRSAGLVETVTAALQCHGTAISERFEATGAASQAPATTAACRGALPAQ